MNYSDFICDFNLYLCERFGYRNCCSVMHNANGICVSVHVGEEYAPRYGYKYLCTEDDDYKYYQTLGLKLIHKGFFRQYNYGLPLKELEV